MPKGRLKVGEQSVVAAMMSDDIRRRDEAKLARLNGWEGFAPMQKKVLGVLPWFQTLEASCRYLGLSAGAVRMQMKRNDLFRQAVEIRRDQDREEIAKEMGRDMLGFAMAKMYTLLTDEEVPHATQLAAVKAVLDMNDLGGSKNKGGAEVNILAQQVKMFDREGA